MHMNAILSLIFIHNFTAINGAEPPEFQIDAVDAALFDQNPEIVDPLKSDNHFADAQQSKKYSDDDTDILKKPNIKTPHHEQLQFIREINGVSIRASNGKYLEWTDGDTLSATSDESESANSLWTISFEKDRFSQQHVIRIMNEAKLSQRTYSFHEPNRAFIRFSGYSFERGVVDLRGGGLNWCWLAIEHINDNKVRFEQKGLMNDYDEANTYLSIDKTTNIAMSTTQKNVQSEFEMFIGDKPLMQLFENGDPDIMTNNEWWNAVLENGGIREFDFAAGSKIESVILNEQNQENMQCALDRKGQKQIFCAFYVSNDLSLSQVKNMEIVIGIEDGDAMTIKKEKMCISAELTSFTVHILFDYVYQRLRVYVLPEINGFIARNKPMGLSNPGDNLCYMNALVQSIIASLKDQISTAQRFKDGDERSMMIIEVLRTYLNQNYAQIIDAYTYKAYMILLCDYLGNERGATHDTMEEFQKFETTHRIPIIREWAEQTQLPPQSTTLTGKLTTENFPPLASWGITLYANQRLSDINGHDISHAELCDLNKQKIGQYHRLVAKVIHHGAHYTVIVRWGDEWFYCNDQRVADYQIMDISTHKRGDHGLFYQLTDIVDITQETLENAQNLVVLAAILAQNALNNAYPRLVKERLSNHEYDEETKRSAIEEEQVANWPKWRRIHSDPMLIDSAQWEKVNGGGMIGIKVFDENLCIAAKNEWNDLELVACDAKQGLVESKAAIWYTIYIFHSISPKLYDIRSIRQVKCALNGQFRFENQLPLAEGEKIGHLKSMRFDGHGGYFYNAAGEKRGVVDSRGYDRAWTIFDVKEEENGIFTIRCMGLEKRWLAVQKMQNEEMRIGSQFSKGNECKFQLFGDLSVFKGGR